jgi:hypothetical protein
LPATSEALANRTLDALLYEWRIDLHTLLCVLIDSPADPRPHNLQVTELQHRTLEEEANRLFDADRQRGLYWALDQCDQELLITAALQRFERTGAPFHRVPIEWGPSYIETALSGHLLVVPVGYYEGDGEWPRPRLVVRGLWMDTVCFQYEVTDETPAQALAAVGYNGDVWILPEYHGEDCRCRSCWRSPFFLVSAVNGNETRPWSQRRSARNGPPAKEPSAARRARTAQAAQGDELRGRRRPR